VSVVHTGPPGVERDRFRDPFNDSTLLLYFRALRDWHGHIRFLGIPQIKEYLDVSIGRLFVEPLLSRAPVSPDLEPARWPPLLRIAVALSDFPRAVVLGDPGSGKSTLVDWLCWQLAQPDDGPLTDWLGRLIPVPLVLRELGIDPAITWDSLLERFLARPMARDSLTRADLDDLAERGQALFLLDGVDEITSREAREALREAVRQGMGKYGKARWLFTSRVIGYEEVPFHQEKELPRGLEEQGERPWQKAPAEDGPALLYLAPFDDGQVERFARLWYRLRDVRADEANRQAEAFLAAVRRSAATTALARVPNLLTLMALIYRVQAHLPDGRAMLFGKIAEAYLESIDTFRELREEHYTLSQKERWLGWVGYRMQQRRQGGAEGEGLLASREDVTRWITEAIEDDGDTVDAGEVDAFLDYLGRRSGLLVPRAEGRYAFLHLSFQEYFAARHLRELFISRRSEAMPIIQEVADRKPWTETLVLLFELLADIPRNVKDLYNELFQGEHAEALRRGEEKVGPRALLLARLAANPHSGLAKADREQEAAEMAVDWQLARHRDRFWEEPLVFQALLNGKEVAERSWPTLIRRAATEDRLNLDGCTGVSDLRPLASLGGLRELSLTGCTGVSDLSPLASLTGLQTLSLSGCTGVSDLSPLASLTEVQWLWLDGCTGVSDLGPLASLGGLQELSLSGCAGVSNLGPLASLARLRKLRLAYCTGVTDLSPLTSLTGLQRLWLDGCTGIRTIPPQLKREGLDLLLPGHLQ
jgi:internalin A